MFEASHVVQFQLCPHRARALTAGWASLHVPAGEYARAQGFPDWYKIEGDTKKYCNRKYDKPSALVPLNKCVVPRGHSNLNVASVQPLHTRSCITPHKILTVG